MKLDIIFANEQEITSLINANSFDEIVTFSKQIEKKCNNYKRGKRSSMQ